MSEPSSESYSSVNEPENLETLHCAKSEGNSNQPETLASEHLNNMPDFSSSYYRSTETSGKFPSPAPRSTIESETVSYCKDVRDSGAVSGHCGLYNLGNTCFMNSGLQSLIGNAKLVKYFLETYKYSEDNKSSLTATFYKLLCKVWSGQYSIIHPRDFKESLGLHHSQFQDYRQHDCQEFLTMLLDSFHEQFLYSSQLSQQIQNNVRDSQTQDTSPTSLLRSTCVVKNKSKTDIKNTESNPSENNIVKNKHLSEEFSLNCKKSEFLMDFLRDDSKKTAISSNSTSNMLPGLTLVSEESNQSAVSVNSNDSVGIPHMKSLKLMSSSNDDVTEVNTHDSEKCLTDETRNSNAEDNIFSNVKTSLESIDIDPQNVPKSNNHREDKTPEHIKDNNMLNNALSPTRFPNLVELYSKESKTLNTNVLATEFLHETIQTDSEKFVKQDNRRVEQDEFEDLLVDNDIQEEVVKVDKIPKVKDVNIQCDRKNQILKSYGQNLWTPCDDEDMCSNNIKRMKMESNEKNIQLQAWGKLNRNQLVVKETEVTALESDNEDEGDIELESDTDEEETNVASSSRSTPCEELNLATFPKIHFSQEDTSADERWHKYLKDNNTVIVNTFQGQFKSTVVCSQCIHVSVTFEPFMFLAVPLPHAMERQLCVIYITEKEEPLKYLLTMQRNDTVAKVKKELRTLIGNEDEEIIMAEVLDYHISRILDDHVLLKYINDANRNVYAFQMVQPQTTQESSQHNEVNDSSPTNQNFADSNPASMECDVFSNVGTFSTNSVTSESPAQANEMKDSDLKDIEMKDIFESTSVWDYMISDEVHMSKVSQSETKITSKENEQTSSCTEQTPVDMAGTGLWNWSECSSDKQKNEWCGAGNGIGAGCPVMDAEGTETVTDQWRNCAICLDELIDSQLVIHTSCGGTLCHTCLEMSLKHYGAAEQTCPVCSTPVSLMEDFVPLGCTTGNVKQKTRILAVPIAYRSCKVEGNIQDATLIGHPAILYLPNNLNGNVLYDAINKVIPFSTDYTVVLTDGQGLHCSRCTYTDHCSGCDIIKDAEVQLLPGDHITVVIPEVSSQQLERAQFTQDHKSMEKYRPNVPITLNDCFTAFSESEILDDQNPWFCPQCCQNQLAKKTIAVWRSPDCVIVQLKRFVFHELSSTKLDNKVVFPFNSLDLSDFISGPKSTNLLYDLQSVICHYGGVHSGHYTAYTKHPIDGEWYYYNDECISKQKPTEEDYSSAYVLIYQRRGSGVSLKIPENLFVEEDINRPVISTASLPSVSYSPQFMPMPDSPEIKLTENDSHLFNPLTAEYIQHLYNVNP